MFLFSSRGPSLLRIALQCKWNYLLTAGVTRTAQESLRNKELEDYLRERFQLNKKSAVQLSRGYSIDDVEERVKYFQSIGLSPENISLVFKKFPIATLSSVVDEMEERVEFLSSYTSRFREPNILITHLIPQYPSLLFYSIDAMKKRVKLLEECDLTADEIARVIRYNPMTILSRLEERFGGLVQYLKNWGLPDKTIHKLFTKQPRSITYRHEAIDKRVRFFMDEIGYSRERMIEVFTNNPMVLTASVERMRERSNFIKGEMGLTNASLLRSPLVLKYSLGRMQWRYRYLRKIGYTVTDDMYILTIVYLTDDLFARTLAKRPLQEVLEFKEAFYENLNKKSQPASVAESGKK